MKKVLVEDLHHVMDFGMHKGKTVGEIFEQNPSYLHWAHTNTDHFRLSPSMYQQVLTAMEENNKAWVAKEYQKKLEKEQQLAEKMTVLKAKLGGEHQINFKMPSAGGNLPDDLPF